MRVERLRERADFLALRRGLVARCDLFTVQVSRTPRESEAVRVGLTVTKKVGNAVVRNRIKRRLRHAVRDSADLWPEAMKGRDVVVIARDAALDAPFERLVEQLRRSVTKALQPRAKSVAGKKERPASA